MLEAIRETSASLKGLRVMHVTSTSRGGGVAEILSSLVPLMQEVGIDATWKVISGEANFFSITKKIHNLLQGEEGKLDSRDRLIYERTGYENAKRMLLDHDVVVIHDPQPLPMATYYEKEKAGAWIWRCHVDLSRPDRETWSYLRGFIEKYDAVIFSSEAYRKDLGKPQFFFAPAIDPFSEKNRSIGWKKIDSVLKSYGIPLDLPIVAQVSRFDKWKDQEGAVRAFLLAREKVRSTLVLLGNMASDDPEAKAVFESLLKYQNKRILVIGRDDKTLVNSLQRKASVILQKSLREGFGLTVTEAMWKKKPVIGGRTGGIIEQISDGKTGFLVSSVEEAGRRMVELLKDGDLRERIGSAAKRSVTRRFLMPRLLLDYLKLFKLLKG